jgi:adenylate kinase
VLIARPDDTPEAIQARLQEYHTKTQPILELFRRKELVVRVDGTRAAAEVQQDLRRQLGQLSPPRVGHSRLTPDRVDND